MIKLITQALCLVLPWPIRRRILSLLFGYTLTPTSRIGLSLILADEVCLEDHSTIGHFNYIGRLDLLQLDQSACIGNFNWVTGLSTRLNSPFYQSSPKRRSDLVLGKCSMVAHQHFIDCTDRIVIGAFSGIAGARSHLITHGVEPITSRQTCAPIFIGSHTMVGAATLVLKGVQIPDKCIVGAGSVIARIKAEPYSLIVGNPASVVRKISEKAKFFERTESVIF